MRIITNGSLKIQLQSLINPKRLQLEKIKNTIPGDQCIQVANRDTYWLG